jgi:hypothetical protein
VFMANAGGSWDNAKKYIEAGAHGGKRTDAHRAAVVGDTVGDPFKDTSGPSLNILIKLMSMVSVVAAGFVVRYGVTVTGLSIGIGVVAVVVAVVIVKSSIRKPTSAEAKPAGVE